MEILLDGKKIRDRIESKVKKRIEESGIKPKLLAISAGKNEANRVYLKVKREACRRVGIEFIHIDCGDAEERDILDEITRGARDDSVDGILVQLPLPNNIDVSKIMESIPAEKDVDGFNPENFGRVMVGKPVFIPCTPKGIMTLLDSYNIEVRGKDVVIINHSPLIGKPLSLLLLLRDATVTVCHIMTKDIERYTKMADILIVGAGKPGLIGEKMVKEGATVIDVGINRVGGKIVGDVLFDEVREKVYAISPVPGGVGPMTVASLLENTLKAAERRRCLKKG